MKTHFATLLICIAFWQSALVGCATASPKPLVSNGSANASQNAATATALPSSWKQFVELFVKQGGLGTWTSKGVTAEMWAGIPAGLEYTGRGTSELAKDRNAIFDSGNMLLKDGRTLSIGTSLTTWDAETGKVVFCNSGFDSGKPYSGIGTLKAIDGSSITWEYVENSRGQTTTYKNITRQVDSNNRVVTVQKLPDGTLWTFAEVRK